MKTHIGFISNSSSTSFIIGYNPQKYTKCPTCGHKPLDIIELVDLHEDSDTKVFQSDSCGINDAIKHIQDNIERVKHTRKIPLCLRKSQWDTDLCLDNEIQSNEAALAQIQSFQSKWQKVVLCDISNHDNVIMDEIRDQKELGLLDFQEMNDNDF